MGKITGASSDGTSVMVGKNSGVMEKLKIVSPHLNSVHCGAHRVNLVATDIFENNKMCNFINKTINETHNFYNFSAKRKD